MATQTLGLEHRVSPRTEEEERTCLASETGLDTTLLGSEESNTTGIRAELLEPGCCVPTCLLYRKSPFRLGPEKGRLSVCLSVCVGGSPAKLPALRGMQSDPGEPPVETRAPHGVAGAPAGLGTWMEGDLGKGF